MGDKETNDDEWRENNKLAAGYTHMVWIYIELRFHELLFIISVLGSHFKATKKAAGNSIDIIFGADFRSLFAFLPYFFHLIIFQTKKKFHQK